MRRLEQGLAKSRINSLLSSISLVKAAETSPVHLVNLDLYVPTPMRLPYPDVDAAAWRLHHFDIMQIIRFQPLERTPT